MGTWKAAYKAAKKAAIREFKLCYYLETNKMLKDESAVHPVEKKSYMSKSVPDSFADHKEWNYLINRLKFEKYNSLIELHSASERHGDRMLNKVNAICGNGKKHRDMPLRWDNIMNHSAHHFRRMNEQDSGVDNARVGRLLKEIDDIRMGLINTIILNLHYL